MSGRDPEPVAAFFPSIDRNLILDLDRHFRQATQTSSSDPSPDASPTNEAPPQKLELPHTRPSTSDVLEAVEQAAASMAAMDQRIQELEARQAELESTNGQLRTKLGEMLQLQEMSETKAREEAERAAQAEGLAAQHLSRAQGLENDLETALGDLSRIAEAITGSLGTPLYRR